MGFQSGGGVGPGAGGADAGRGGFGAGAGGGGSYYVLGSIFIKSDYVFSFKVRTGV